MQTTKERAFSFRALVQKIRNYFIRNYRWDWKYSFLNPRYNKYQKLQTICNSLTDKYWWIDDISHWYSVEEYDFDEYETAITLNDNCRRYEYLDNDEQEQFENEFRSLIAKSRLSDCVYKRFAYRRFDHDRLEYMYE